MSYSLAFKEEAWKEWGKLDNGVREQFEKKLEGRLFEPARAGIETVGSERPVQNQTAQCGLPAGL